MHSISPALEPVKIASLRPTQITVGMAEVQVKRREWQTHSSKHGAAYLGHHVVPCVRGPKDNLWLVDHHHLALALHLEGQEEVLVSIIADLAHLTKERFLTFMDNRNWLHPYDEEGKRCTYVALPKSVQKLRDDPYRSLAGMVRGAGGYSKDTTPYAEFLWADYFRDRVSLKASEISDKSLNKALALAHEHDASYLPGWCGTK
jgi:hypothetical protein